MSYHLVGIGGAAMSGLARMLKTLGHHVTGSDIEKNDETERLIREGFEVKIGHSKENIRPDTTVVVTIPAIPAENVELEEAKKRNLAIVTRSSAMANLMKDRVQIGIAGTHGKTTTTAMLVSIFIKAGLDPSFMIGGTLPGIGNAKVGSGPHFIFEADEYANQFLDFAPAAASISNLEPDHLDYFGSFETLKEAFVNYVDRLTPMGVLIVGENVPKDIIKDFKGALLTVGFNEGNFRITNLELTNGLPKFDLEIKGKKLVSLHLKVPGSHNAFNASVAFVLALSSGVSPETAEQALVAYSGVERRFQIYIDRPELTLVDDYGHHPTEIKATLEAVRSRFPNRKLITVFQPHQYSRTKLLFDGFVEELAKSDEVVLAPIWRVRDSDDAVKSVSIEQLKSAIAGKNANTINLPTYEDIAKHLAKRMDNESGLTILTMGAAPINKVAELLSKRIG